MAEQMNEHGATEKKVGAAEGNLKARLLNNVGAWPLYNILPL
jgi:hypothetical protein